MLAAAPQVVIDAGAIAGSLTACGLLLAGIWRIPVVRRLWVRNVTEPRDERLKEVVRAVVDPIIAELRPNGGSSLRDAVDRQEWRLARLEKHAGLTDAVGRPYADEDGA